MVDYSKLASIGKVEPKVEKPIVVKEVKQPSNQATKQPRLQETNIDDNFERIRKAVKQLGKETTSYRLHELEKESLDDILYELKKQGIRSNENEIVRIAINHLIDDYTKNKNASLLVTVLERLKA